MPNGRLIVLSALFLAVLAVQLLAVVLKRAFWPLIPFSMFSPIVGEETSHFVPFGVVADTGAELPLLDPSLLQPFAQGELRLALGALIMRRDPRLLDALRDVLVRYERLRARGAHAGPPLVGVRVYSVRSRLPPGAVRWEIVTKRLAEELLVDRRTSPAGAPA